MRYIVHHHLYSNSSIQRVIQRNQIAGIENSMTEWLGGEEMLICLCTGFVFLASLHAAMNHWMASNFQLLQQDKSLCGRTAALNLNKLYNNRFRGRLRFIEGKKHTASVIILNARSLPSFPQLVVGAMKYSGLMVSSKNDREIPSDMFQEYKALFKVIKVWYFGKTVNNNLANYFYQYSTEASTCLCFAENIDYSMVLKLF